jgi:hypothetical protein
MAWALRCLLMGLGRWSLEQPIGWTIIYPPGGEVKCITPSGIVEVGHPVGLFGACSAV